MSFAAKKKTTLFILLAVLTFAAFCILTAYSFAVIQLAEFIFTLSSLGDDTWLK